MVLNPKDALEAARDIATTPSRRPLTSSRTPRTCSGQRHRGRRAIVQDSVDIATHAVERTKDVFTKTPDPDAE